MSDEEKDVSPEEKLLKVIQGEGEEDAAKEEATEPAVSAEPAAAESEAPEEQPDVAKKDEAEAKPELKVVPKKTDEKAPETSAPAPEESAAEAPALIGGAAASAAPKKITGKSAGLKFVNTAIAALIIAMLGLTGYEIFAAIRAGSDSVMSGNSSPDEIEVPKPPEAGKPYDPDDLMKMYSSRSLFGIPDAKAVVPAGAGAAQQQKQVKTITVAQVNWQVYAEQNLKIAGFCRPAGEPPEVVIYDQKTRRQYFMKAGDELPIDKHNLKLDKIDNNMAYFTDGSGLVAKVK